MVVCAEFLVQVAEFLMKWQGEWDEPNVPLSKLYFPLFGWHSSIDNTLVTADNIIELQMHFVHDTNNSSIIPSHLLTTGGGCILHQMSFLM